MINVVIDSIKRSKYGLVVLLRKSFSELDPTGDYQNFIFNQKEEKSKIAIHPFMPARVVKFPCIIVAFSRGDASITYLQDEYLLDQEDKDKNLVLYGGRVYFDLEIRIISNTASEGAIIADLVTFFTRHLYKTVLREHSVEIRNITISPERLMTIEGRPLHEFTITIGCMTEYQRLMDLSMVERIRKINLAVEIEELIKEQP